MALLRECRDSEKTMVFVSASCRDSTISVYANSKDITKYAPKELPKLSLLGPFSQEYRCSRNAPLNCDQPQQTIQQVPGAKFCLECGFPATLPSKAEIRGSRGTYQVTSFLGTRGMGRLYTGVQLNNNQPVVIKEYLLPNRCFDAEEARQRQETFIRIAGVSSADGKIQDFRLISPWEAIADQQGERCYLVTQGMVSASQTLSCCLLERGAMTAPQVREVLNQVLQTLQFLHAQKLRLPSGQVRQGLVHGNLSLDSILIVQNDQEFFIYLCDLAVWERLFDPPAIQALSFQPKEDLVDLGQAAFYLWAGRVLDPALSQSLNPKDEQQWSHSDPYLKQFLQHLIGLDSPFESAEAARQALLQLPQVGQAESSAVLIAPDQKRKGLQISWIIPGVIALLIAGVGLWYFLERSPRTPTVEYVEFDKLLPQFFEVNGILAGEYTYSGERVGTWSSILRKKLESERIFEEVLTKPQPNVEAQFNYHPMASVEDVKTLEVETASKPIEEVRAGRADFAITTLGDTLADDLDSDRVAYDGLLVFVASSKKDQNLPKALNGQINLEQLRQLYTGEVMNWQELGGPNLPVVLHIPTDPEAIQQFKHKVLKDDPQQIALFTAKVTTLSTEQTQKQIVSNFDKGQAGIISFGVLSKTWDQCSGYPLAIVNNNNLPSQVLLERNGQPIDPTIDLCKKNTRLDIEAFVTGAYPLGYPLSVVYPRDNNRSLIGLKFAELLKTRQGQRLLRKAGVIPLQPVRDN
jgi:ABC-type phosphate transport system substrate-binding protein